MRLITALVLVLLGTASAAFAQEDSDPRLYAGLRGSFAFESSVNAKAAVTPPVTAKANFDMGGGASIFWGIDLPAGFDAELEMLYRYMPLKDGVVNGVSGKLDGYGHMFAPMLNVYWTAPLDFPVKPYIGAGIGYAWNEIGVSAIGATTFPTVRDDRWRLAYNVMAGIVIPSSEDSRFTLGYRWLHENVGINCGATITCSGNLTSHSIDLGYLIDL